MQWQVPYYPDVGGFQLCYAVPYQYPMMPPYFPMQPPVYNPAFWKQINAIGCANVGDNAPVGGVFGGAGK